MRNEMKEVGGIFLPITETHMDAWMRERKEIVDGKLTYQYHKLLAALAFVRNFRVAVDVGAHCGLWSMHLAKRFQFVQAFEPVALHRRCFAKNVTGANVELHDCALGERHGHVSMHSTPGSSGDSWVSAEVEIIGKLRGDEAEVAPLRTLDSYALPVVDFIKLDCEGYELFALRGAEDTLRRCRPCVIVEQKPGKAQKFALGETDAVAYLRSLGAHLRSAISGDFIMSWDAEQEEPSGEEEQPRRRRRSRGE